LNKISVAELRKMNGEEGLILQGCGGDLQEWVTGVNDMLTEENILKNGTSFSSDRVCSFQNGQITCLLFPFDDSVNLDMGKLAIWRLKTHESFGGTWLSDYVPNQLGGFTQTEYERLVGNLADSSVYVSPDFQCEQTEGFPTSLCVNWEKGKAWLALNQSMIEKGEDVSHFEKLCEDYGIRECRSAEQFNDLLRGLGEEALESGELVPEEGPELGGLT
jgi:hypothetical protein